MEIGKGLKSVLLAAKNFKQIDKDFIKAKLQALTQLQSGVIKTGRSIGEMAVVAKGFYPCIGFVSSVSE